MEVNVNNNIDLNFKNDSVDTSYGITNSSKVTTNNSNAYQTSKITEVEEMDLSFDTSNTVEDTQYTSTAIGKLLQNIESTKNNIYNSVINAFYNIYGAKDPKQSYNLTKRDILEAITIQALNENLEDIDLNYNSISEMDDKIKSLTKEIEEARKSELSHEMSELEATNRLIEYMSSNFENLDEAAANCLIAYKCKDSNGDIVYFYGNLGEILGTDYEIIEEISYKDMYGESDTYKKLQEIIPKRQEEYKDGILWWAETKTREVQNLEWTDEQKIFYNELSDLLKEEGYHDFYNEDESTKKLLEQRETLTYLRDYINTEIDFYLKNVDPYINAQDFELNNDYKDNNKNLSTICTGESYKSGYVETKSITNVEDMIALLSCHLNKTNNVINDNVYIYDQNDSITGIFKYTCTDDIYLHYLKDWGTTINDEEVEIFNYINNTQGAQAAYNYLTDIASTMDQRWLNDERKKDKEWAENNKILASAGSVFVTPFEGIGAAYHSLNNLLTGSELWRTDVYSKGAQWRGSVAAAIEKDNPVGAFAYGTLMSVADTGALIALNTVTGGTVTTALSLATMGSRSYVSSLNDALDRGIDNKTAIGYAFGAAAIETICESYSVGHLMNLEDKIGDKTISFIKTLAPENSLESKILYVAAGAITQGLAEGEEELCTEILGTFYDQIVCKDQSKFNLAINEYELQGMSEDEAILNAFKDEAKECSLSFAGGFLSGVGFGGVQAGKITRQADLNNMNVFDLDSQIKDIETLKKVSALTIADKVKGILSSINNLHKRTSSEYEIVDVRRGSTNSDYKTVEVRRASSYTFPYGTEKVLNEFNLEEYSKQKSLIEEIEKQINAKINDIDLDSEYADMSLDELKRKKIIEEQKIKSIFKLDTEPIQCTSIGNMTEAEIRASVQEELNNLNNINENYQRYVDLLKRKEELELELYKNLKLESNISQFSNLNEDLQQEVESRAKDIYNNALSIENKITEDIQKLKGSDAFLEGTDFKVKSIDSIKEKLARSLLQGNNIDKAVSEVNDSLRYTLIVDDITYSNSVIEKLAQLEDTGYKVQDMKNAWGNKTYQGLEITLISPSGDLVELQFHTKESYDTNQDLNNELYEISRGSYSNDTKNISNEIQKINQELYVNNVGFAYNQVGELQDAINNYRINKASKIKKLIYTDINEEHAYDKQLSPYRDIDYIKYPGTELPEQCVIDSQEEILKYGSTIEEGLKAIEEKYGKNSIQATTARGKIVMDFIDNNNDNDSISVAYNAEGFAKVQKRIKSIYEAAGINVKDYTEDVLSLSESTFEISDLKKVSDKVCNEVFKSHHEFWENADSTAIDAMHKYSKGYDDKINKTLRTEILADELCPQLIEKLTSQILSLDGLKENTLLYRGLRDLNWICDGVLAEISNDKLAEMINGLGGGLYEINDNGFASSTPILSQGFTCTRPIIEVTACPKNTRGTYLGDLSLCPDEVEYLVNPGSGNKKVILGAEEIGGKIYVFTQMLE